MPSLQEKIILDNRKKLFTLTEKCKHSDNDIYYYSDLDEINFHKTKDFVALSGKPGILSYSRNLKEPFLKKNRVDVSIAKYIRRNLKINDKVVSDSDLDNFTSLMKISEFDRNSILKEIEILRGAQLVDFYKTTKIHSCMTGKDNSKYVELYGKNSASVGLVTYKDEARALIWKTNNKKIYIDRIYSNSLFGRLFIKKYAIVNNIKSVFYEDCDDDYSITVDDFVKMKASKYYPCMDSFSFGRLSLDKKYIYLQTDPCNFYASTMELCRTNGTFNKVKLFY
jgi:hypothetical protein